MVAIGEPNKINESYRKKEMEREGRQTRRMLAKTMMRGERWTMTTPIAVLPHKVYWHCQNENRRLAAYLERGSSPKHWNVPSSQLLSKTRQMGLISKFVCWYAMSYGAEGYHNKRSLRWSLTAWSQIISPKAIWISEWRASIWTIGQSQLTVAFLALLAISLGEYRC